VFQMISQTLETQVNRQVALSCYPHCILAASTQPESLCSHPKLLVMMKTEQDYAILNSTYGVCWVHRQYEPFPHDRPPRPIKFIHPSIQ
jgi:hypothetical protein